MLINQQYRNLVIPYKDCEIIIWTTTPWTIPANKALAYNENLNYALIKICDEGDFKDKKIMIAESLIESVVKDCNINNHELVKRFKGKELKGTLCRTNFSLPFREFLNSL